MRSDGEDAGRLGRVRAERDVLVDAGSVCERVLRRPRREAAQGGQGAAVRSDRLGQNGFYVGPDERLRRVDRGQL